MAQTKDEQQVLTIRKRLGDTKGVATVSGSDGGPVGGGSVGGLQIYVEDRDFVCLECGKEFQAQMIFNVAIPVFVAHMQTIRCPQCGAGGDRRQKGIAFKFASDDTAMQTQVLVDPVIRVVKEPQG